MAQPMQNRSVVHVANVGEVSYSFDLGDDRKIVIEGKHPYLQRTGIISKYVMTQISSDDWDAINVKYKGCNQLKHNTIFAEKTEYETITKASDDAIQSIKRGTEQLTYKDLVSGGQSANGVTGNAKAVA